MSDCLKTCNGCRFFNNGSCAKFSIKVDENFVACNDHAEKVSINESAQKIKLYD